MTTKAPKAAQFTDDQPHLPRRNFLKGATLAGTAAAIAVAPAAERRAHGTRRETQGRAARTTARLRPIHSRP